MSMMVHNGVEFEPWASGGGAVPELTATVLGGSALFTPAGGTWDDIIIPKIAANADTVQLANSFAGLPVGEITPSSTIVTNIGAAAFAGTRIKEYTITNTGTTVTFNGLSFAYCYLLEKILFSWNNSLRVVVFTGASQFRDCRALQYIQAPDWVINTSSSALPSDTFKNCESFNQMTKNSSGTALSINGGCWENCFSLEKPLAPGQTIVGLGVRALAGCTGLSDVVIPFSPGSAITGLTNADAFAGSPGAQITLDLTARTAKMNSGTNTFRDVDVSDGPLTVQVPSTLLASYRADAIWATPENDGRIQLIGV